MRSKQQPPRKNQSNRVLTRPSSHGAPIPRKMSAPGEMDALMYAAALSDPWNAPASVGIPIGGTGLPTFKTKKYFRAMFDTAPSLDYEFSDGVNWAPESNLAYFEIQYPPGGNLTLSGGRTSDVNDIQYGPPTSITHGRIVAASIRLTRHGRADDAGTSVIVNRRGYGEAESDCYFAQKDNIQVNYIPRTNWDLEYKEPSTGNANNFTTAIRVGVKANVPSTYMAEFCVIIESNDSTPPPDRYNVGDYATTTHAVTTPAPTILPHGLSKITQHAAKGTMVPYHASHDNFGETNTPGFIGTINKVANTAGSWLDSASAIGSALSGAWNTVSKVAPWLTMLL
jgi:hypothetical protein